MAAVRAIVFDTNVFGKDPIPNSETIEFWAGACAEHDAELWIPEVVAYELAEHAVSAERSFLESYERHAKRRSRMGLDPLPSIEPVSQEDVVGAIEHAGARIIPTPPAAAHEALMDQVRQRGAATRKSDVKTGAADSAWIRSIITESAEAGDPQCEGLIVVTGDTGALEATCKQVGLSIPRNVRNTRELRALIGEEGPASDEQVRLVTDFLTEHLQSRDFGGPDLAELAGLERTRGNWWDVGVDDDGYEPWEFQEAYLTPERTFELVGHPEWDAWSQSVVAEVVFNTDVEEQYARQDRWGDEPEYLGLMYAASVRGRMTFSIAGDAVDTDWVLEDPQLDRAADEDVVSVSI